MCTGSDPSALALLFPPSLPSLVGIFKRITQDEMPTKSGSRHRVAATAINPRVKAEERGSIPAESDKFGERAQGKRSSVPGFLSSPGGGYRRNTKRGSGRPAHIGDPDARSGDTPLVRGR